MRATFAIGAMAALCGCADGDALFAATPPLRDEAGFVAIERVGYAIHHDGYRTELTSSEARLWYAFQPADEAPEQKPLAVLWNGGPGASTGILFGLGTAKRTFDPARTGGAEVADNPARWSRFANLLYIDARGTGFSYGLAPGASAEEARRDELGARSFNPLVDAADFVRVILRFLAAHPALRRSEVILVGESYGGIRASIVLDMLLSHERYRGGDRGYEDPALASEIEAHLDALLGDGAGRAATPAEVARQFGRLVLLQPRLSSPDQDAAAGPLLEAADSPLFAIAAETGAPFVTCAEKPPPCDAYQNAMAFLDAVGRDAYDVRAPAGSTLAAYDAVEPRFTSLGTLAAALGTDPAAIPELYADRRADAWRTIEPATDAEPLGSTFGELAPWDRYYRVALFDEIGPAFYGAEAKALGIERTSPRWGELFLEDARWIDVLVTDAANDTVVYSRAIPGALARYDAVVAGAEREDGPAGEARPGRIRLSYRDGTERRIRFPRYEDAGHSVTLHAPLELASDVAAWISASP